MTDEDRALAEIQRRRAPSEPAIVPRSEFDDDHLTPVQPVIEKVHAELCDRIVLSEREQWLTRTLLDLLVPAVWRHAANVEMRGRKRSDSQDSAQLARRVDDVEATLDEKFGRSRKNGDFGTLKERVDKAEARRWWLITFAAGLLVTVIGSAIAFGSWMGSIETDVETLKFRARGDIPSFSPDDPASKGLP